MNSLISIITPNYNCESFISQTIESVLKQTYSQWELIIVDDCSTDNSYKIAIDYASYDKRIKVIKNEKNFGAAISRNKALDIAKGEYIAFLDSDDLWEPNKLEYQLKFMQENNCDFSFTRYNLIDEDNNEFKKIAKIVKRLTYFKYLHHCYTGCLTVMYRFDIAEDLRSFNIKNNNDYGLFLQVVRNASNAMGINKVLAHYRIRKSSISRNKIIKIKPYFELMRKHLHIPFLFVCWFLFTNILISKIWKYENKHYTGEINL